jgi:hypothetical protein
MQINQSIATKSARTKSKQPKLKLMVRFTHMLNRVLSGNFVLLSSFVTSAQYDKPPGNLDAFLSKNPSAITSPEINHNSLGNDIFFCNLFSDQRLKKTDAPSVKQ